MKAKKAEHQMAMGKIITLVLVVLVILFSFVMIFMSQGVKGYIENLFPDSWTGANPGNLTVIADVYGKKVELLVNDGKGRCIVSNTFNYAGDDTWLMNYGIRKNQLIIRDDITSDKWGEVNTGFDRVTNNMRQEGLYPLEVMKNQLIKQDLFVGCYRDKSSPKDFITATINGQEVTILKEDEFKRCLIYESLQNPELEHYSLNNPLLASPTLYILDNEGQWKPEEQVSDEQIEEIELAKSLIEDEKNFASYLSEFKMSIQPSSQSTMERALEQVKKGDISGFSSIYHYDGTQLKDGSQVRVIFFKYNNEGNLLEYNPLEIRNQFLNNLREERGDDRSIKLGNDGGFSSYVYVNGEDLAVRGGKIYKISRSRLVETNEYDKYVGYSKENLDSLRLQKQIKSDLEKAC